MTELRPGENCWRVEHADRASVVIDADDYYSVLREAMLTAKKQILLVGWDFDSRIRLAAKRDRPKVPNTVGDFITWLVGQRPELQVYVLRWDKGALKTLVRGATLWTLTKWRFTHRIHLKLDAHHPIGASQHQKIVVIDDCIAFCGGIDVTSNRWDTRQHHDRERRRRTPWGRRYKPWHDATTAVSGAAATALGELCRERWHIAGGHRIGAPEGGGACWPERLPVDFTDIKVAIARSQPEWLTQPQVLEIETLYLDMIARAKRRLYIESQYFASRRIAEALQARLDDPDGPEIVVINPVKAQGVVEPIAMDSARARLIPVLEAHGGSARFAMYHPVTSRGRPIYVHAKIMVVDDVVIRVGSSNFNNRSLRLDTECDVMIDADQPGNERAKDRIAEIRDGLIAEHLGVEPGEVTALLADGGSMIAAIEQLRGRGKTLIPYAPPQLPSWRVWLADNEILDPEGPDAMFEAPWSRRGLLRRLARRVRRR